MACGLIVYINRPNLLMHVYYIPKGMHMVNDIYIYIYIYGHDDVIKENIKARVTDPFTGGFPTQRVSNAGFDVFFMLA